MLVMPFAKTLILILLIRTVKISTRFVFAFWALAVGKTLPAVYCKQLHLVVLNLKQFVEQMFILSVVSRL
jgi:hypothetical protein